MNANQILTRGSRNSRKIHIAGPTNARMVCGFQLRCGCAAHMKVADDTPENRERYADQLCKLCLSR